jgi:hypothetical protein
LSSVIFIIFPYLICYGVFTVKEVCFLLSNAEVSPQKMAAPRCPTTDEWIKKMWYLYTMEFYSAKKKNETLSFTGKCKELENIILSAVS